MRLLSAYLFRIWRIGNNYYSEDRESIYFSYEKLESFSIKAPTVTAYFF